MERRDKGTYNFKFIDLFSGIGGFHQAMTQLGGECVLASEIDANCNQVYKQNYHMDSAVNVRDLNEKTDIPDHDVLCAGFPCQAFSKAGKQAGLKDQTRGTLFFEIERILREKKPEYIVLENVRNLVSHDHHNTWRIIHAVLQDCGYRLTEAPLIVSPHQFGIPQLRERVIILGKYDPKHVDEPLDIQISGGYKKEDNSIYEILDEQKVEDKYYISAYEKYVLSAWDEFYQGIDLKVIGFPIWADYFKYKAVPQEYPAWKQNFVKKNMELYQRNQVFIDAWLEKYNNLQDFVPTHHKMEWQAGTAISTLWEGIIQMRPSGIRVKAPTCFPALVAMVQIPIIGRYKRRLTVEEAGEGFICDSSDQQAYKQFGNSVNVEVMRRCTQELFDRY